MSAKSFWSSRITLNSFPHSEVRAGEAPTDLAHEIVLIMVAVDAQSAPASVARDRVTRTDPHVEVSPPLSLNLLSQQSLGRLITSC